jgi:hypothetical protein
MQPFAHGHSPEFWAGNHRGRPIAIFHREGRWHVYLDHALQYNVLFGTAQEAIAWLTRRIDRDEANRLGSISQAA